MGRSKQSHPNLNSISVNCANLTLNVEESWGKLSDSDESGNAGESCKFGGSSKSGESAESDESGESGGSSDSGESGD